MKNNKLKIILITLFVLFSLFSGALYYASTKISSDDVRKATLEALEKKFPKAKVEIGKIAISLGPSITVTIEELNLNTRRNKKNYKMAKIGNLSVKIPIWAIIFGGGTIQVRSEKPEINYHEFSKSNNWSYAMDDDGKSNSVTLKSSKSGNSNNGGESDVGVEAFAIPAFITNSKLHLKITDVGLTYRLKDKSKGKVLLSKFLIKDLNFNSSTAFEIASFQSFQMKNGNEAAFKTLLIGSFNLSELIESKKITSRIVLKLTDIKISNIPMVIPDLKTDLELEVGETGDLKSKFNVAFLSRNHIKGNLSVSSKNGISVEGIDVDLFMQDLMDIAKFSNKSISAGSSKLNLTGSINISAKQKITPNLNFALKPGMKFNEEGLKGELNLKGSYKKAAFKISSINSVAGGTLDIGVIGNFNLNNKNLDIAKMSPTKINLKLLNFTLPKKTIQKTLYPEVIEKTSQASGNVKSNKGSKPATEKVDSTSPVIPPSTIIISWDKIKIGNEVFNGSGEVLLSSKKIVTKYLKFNYSGGTGKLTHVSNLTKNKTSSVFNFDLKNLNLEGLDPFLPKYVKQITGVVNGKIKGDATIFANEKIQPRYNVSVNIKAKKGEIKGIDLSEKVNSLLSSVPAVKKKIGNKKIDIDGNFEDLTFVGVLNEGRYDFNKIVFIGVDKKAELRGKGNLFPPPLIQSGKLDLEYKDNTGKLDKLLKDAGTKTLPIRLIGPGFTLKADYNYTIKKLAKGLLKNKGKKVLKKKLKGLGDKLLKGGGDNKKLNKLLKGFF
jgi:hypothetical protein